MDYRDGIKVLWTTVVMNLVLSLIKFMAGIFGRSTAMIADAVHSLSDVVTTLIAIAAVKIANKEADADHPYGHEKFESILVKLLSLVLLLTGLGIGYKSFLLFLSGESLVPGKVAIYGAVLSIVIKEGMYWYTIRAAKKLGSLSMRADAWHHRTDAISSIIALMGILGSRMGYLYLDALAGIVVSGFIAKLGIDFYLQAVGNLTDRSLAANLVHEIRETIYGIPGVERVVEIKTRIFGNGFYADIIIAVNPELTVAEAYEISSTVHDMVEEFFPDCKHCAVQIMPSIPFSSERELIR